MRNVPNHVVQGLIRYIPKIISCVEIRNVDSKTYNAIRLTKKILRHLEKIENENKQPNSENGNNRL